MRVAKPGASKTFRMQDLRPARDKHWKQRVKEGLAADGKTKLSDLKRESREQWAEATARSVGGDDVLIDAAKEAKDRAKSLGFVYQSSVASIREAAKRGDPAPDVTPHLVKRNHVQGDY